MATYQTKQKKAVMDFLREGHDCAYTIEDIIEGIASELPKEQQPGKSTIYRIVSQLVSEGYVKRQIRDGSRVLLYQLAEKACEGCHLHLKCTGCGQLIHMDDDVSANILIEVLRDRGFAVDEEQTVLLGKCAQCAANSEEKSYEA